MHTNVTGRPGMALASAAVFCSMFPVPLWLIGQQGSTFAFRVSLLQSCREFAGLRGQLLNNSGACRSSASMLYNPRDVSPTSVSLHFANLDRCSIAGDNIVIVSGTFSVSGCACWQLDQPIRDLGHYTSGGPARGRRPVGPRLGELHPD